MFPDSKWLDALKLPLKVTISVALASAILLLCSWQGRLDLGPFGPTARGLLIISSVVFSVLSVVGIVEFLMGPTIESRKQSALATRRAVRKAEANAERGEAEAVILARLDHLSRHEMRYVAECLENNTPTFYTYVHAPPVGALLGKKLIWTDGAQHHQDHYPFNFHDFVWRALLERKSDFLAKEADFKAIEEAEKKAQARRRY